MAYYQNLPIYRKIFELILYIETIVRNFPRYHKYAIGAEMRSLSKNIAVLIIRANSQRDKVGALTELRDKCEEKWSSHEGTPKAGASKRRKNEQYNMMQDRWDRHLACLSHRLEACATMAYSIL